MRILALDTATHCGWAHSPSNESGVWDLTPKMDESRNIRLLSLKRHLLNIRSRLGVDAVAFESLIMRPNTGKAVMVQSEFLGVVKLWCEEEDILYKGFLPSVIKKHATGKGNASKDRMLIWARRKWPDVKFKDDNQADAMWLLDLAKKEFE